MVAVAAPDTDEVLNPMNLSIVDCVYVRAAVEPWNVETVSLAIVASFQDSQP